jgi:hypothetical protein
VDVPPYDWPPVPPAPLPPFALPEFVGLLPMPYTVLPETVPVSVLLAWIVEDVLLKALSNVPLEPLFSAAERAALALFSPEVVVPPLSDV